MNVKYKAHADRDTGIVKPLVRARQKCNECGKLIKPLFQPTPDSRAVDVPVGPYPAANL